MKSFYSFLFSYLFVIYQLFSQNTGKVIENQVIISKIMGKTMKHSIYLPHGYDISSRYYPVVYLLHGYSDDETAWVQFGSAHYAADQLINKGEINPMIIIMPDGALTWYINSHDSKVNYMDYLTKELIPYIDKTYRTKASKEYRAIAGLSMGGYGAIINILKNPHIFSTCVAFSAAVWTDDDITSKNIDYEVPWFAKNTPPNERLNKHWKAHSIFEIINSTPADSLIKLRLYIDCGDKDFLTTGNAKLHIALREKNINHEYRVRHGWHNWNYWQSGIYDGLKYIAQGFDRR
ncbi:MAG: alpha/beta hydrolase-fold protein [Cytophagales bacterium]|nr:alpha/beta hydrolase-fold protein [Cytophagales bacterium]